MPKDGYVTPTFKEEKWNYLKRIAKHRGYKSVQKMIYREYLGENTK